MEEEEEPADTQTAGGARAAVIQKLSASMIMHLMLDTSSLTCSLTRMRYVLPLSLLQHSPYIL